jgi:hypothetical protein
MTPQTKRRFPWGVLTVLFGIAAVVFILAALGLGSRLHLAHSVGAPTATVPPSGTPVLATPTPTPVTSPETSNNPLVWPPNASTVTDILAIMGGISSIGTLLSFIGLLGRGVQSVGKRVRRSPS